MFDIRDVRIDTYSNNNGPQHIRLTHIPTSVVIEKPIDRKIPFIEQREKAILELEEKVINLKKAE